MSTTATTKIATASTHDTATSGHPPTGGRSRIGFRSTARLAIGLGVAAAVGLGAQTFAGEEDDSSDAALPPPGEIVLPQEQSPAPGPLADGSDSLIATTGEEYDPTILTKFIHGRGFEVLAGPTAGNYDDVVSFHNVDCLRPDAESTGNRTTLWAPLELPDGALIKRVIFVGEDNDAAEDISVHLIRSSTVVALGMEPTLTNEQVVAFSTSGASAGDSVVVASPENLDEPTGYVAPAPQTTEHRFHAVRVELRNAALDDHQLCGIEVQYQVPAGAGEAYYPIEPMRVFDSRIDSYDESGPLGPGESKVIDVSDGYDLDGVIVPALVDAVPFGATAITYNIAVVGTTGTNFVSATAGDATEFATAVLNYGADQALSNSATVPVDAAQQIKIWGGDQDGSAHVVVDVTGFYAPPVLPNTGN